MFEDSLAVLRQAKPGSLVPFVHTEEKVVDVFDYFSKLSDFGRKPGSVLFESAELVSGYGEHSMGFADPILRIIFKDPDLRITALSPQGERFLAFLGERAFPFVEGLRFSAKEVTGRIPRPKAAFLGSEDERLLRPGPLDALRVLAFAFKPTLHPFKCSAGLFGAFSYDFIDRFEDLPLLAERPEPDYEFYFADSLFLVDHKKNKTHFIANALVTDDDVQGQEEYCRARLEALRDKFTGARTLVPRFAPRKAQCPGGLAEKEFLAGVQEINERILAGDVFQAVLSAETELDFNAVPLEAYKALRETNPSPYLFFFSLERGQLLAASPEMGYRVDAENGGGGGKRFLEVRPIAGTRPRGLSPDEDARLEVELLTDPKEVAEHAMLVDLARNDVARASVPGTRQVFKPFTVEKYSHVQHLVSTVRGQLKPGLDALHAYAACMNPGTLTGAPKPEAMKLLRKLEGGARGARGACGARGFYGGLACYLTPNGVLDSAIVIRAIRLLDGKAKIRAGAGIVLDSSPEAELAEVKAKMRACVEAVKKTGGIFHESALD